MTTFPLLGAWLKGESVERYLELPPRAVATDQPEFSTLAFYALAGFLLVVLAPFAIRMLRRPKSVRQARRHGFPWWGSAGLALVALTWFLAWNRFSWFAPLQSHTFTPLWIGYVLVVNALCRARTGSCLMRAQPRIFIALFPISALFWWFFEFLNRFVGNWYYVDVEQYSPGEYTILATLSFSTVLPAVMSTAHYLSSFPRIEGAFVDIPAVRLPGSSSTSVLALLCGCLALAAIGAWPQYLFPLVWISPLLVVFPILALTGAETGLAGLANGDWRPLAVPALAALLCGFFWEMWNYGSQARWAYTIPFVDHLQVFELPLLGYAGYLPFGVECFAASMLVAPLRSLSEGAQGRPI